MNYAPAHSVLGKMIRGINFLLHPIDPAFQNIILN